MRITDFTELTIPTSNDLLVVVDVVNDITKKLKLSSLPIPTSVTTALATKQDTLVSGTNIKTLNSVSLLGSGDIVLAATPSGVAGAIQFSNGSAFASDASNLFWDDTNNRLGVGTNAPTLPIDILGGTSNGGLKVRAGNTTSQNILDVANNAGTQGFFYRAGDNVLQYYGYDFSIESQSSSGNIKLSPGSGSGEVRIGSTSGGKLSIKGSGSTSATTSLLVQNSAGSQLLKVADNGETTIGNVVISGGATKSNVLQSQYFNTFTNSFSVMEANAATGNARFYQFISVGKTTDPVASAALEVVSTSKGFLPPRMTTTEKNAIASPATGLVLYDTTTNKLQCYNGSTWNDLF